MEEKEQYLFIKIVHVNGDDQLSLELTATAHLGLGMIARAKHELEQMEQSIYEELKMKKDTP
jgi:hypothetical protein